jgi:phospholipase C
VNVKTATLICCTIAIAACTASPISNSSFAPSFAKSGRASQTPIAHVVFIIQENRSFNDLFFGYPGATTAAYGYDSQGRKVLLRARALGDPSDPGHASSDFFAACDGQGKLPGTKCKMDGWNTEPDPEPTPTDLPYSYVRRSDTKQYWTIAGQYVLADHTFASNLDGSYIAHQYAVAAYASHGVDYPTSGWGCYGGPSDKLQTLTTLRTYGRSISACFDNLTLGQEADAAGVSWRSYDAATGCNGGLWSSYAADRKIFDGPDWSTDVISPPFQFLPDISNGELAAITWITPIWQTSDHAGVMHDGLGPAWIASLVNAIGKSRFWKSTAIFILWDDWGGWFDPVPPVFENYDGLGFRVPLMIVSPYAKRGSVTHVQYETASVLRFIEDDFGLPQLAKADARANDPANDSNAFDFTQRPRTFAEIPGGKPLSFWKPYTFCQSALRAPENPAIGD